MNINNYSEICKIDDSLRPYQQKAKKEIFESWDKVDSVMFQMPTGTGKTRLFTSIIHDINQYSIQLREAVKILIIAHRTELIDQIDEHLKGYKVPHNVIAGGREKNYKYPVSVASIQTITNSRNLEEAKKLKVQFIIIDEAHHALAASYKKLWKMYPNAKRLGVTATPWRMNHQSFLDLFDKLVLSMSIKDFIRHGYLSTYKYFSLKDNSDIQKIIDGIELDKFGEYKESSMEEKMDIGSIRAQLLDSYLSLAEGKKGIIYAINIEHAKHICEEYKTAGYKAVSIDSKTPASERKELVGNFKKGLIDIIVNVDIFSEGFDCPDIEFIQLARPTRSLVKYLQQVGRGLRPTTNKENCLILDNVGMYSRFGLPDARRHWKYHFLGKQIPEETKKLSNKGVCRMRYVDLSEGTEDMELIQDTSDNLEYAEDPMSILETSGNSNTTSFESEDESVEDKSITQESDDFSGSQEDSSVGDNKQEFNPFPILKKYNYEDDNFIFWDEESENIYEAYIQDDSFFIISEMIIDESKHCVHRKRVGKISKNSWMFSQLDKMQVDSLKSIIHYKGNYTVFHYQITQLDNSIKDMYFDYKGREVVSPDDVKSKYEDALKEEDLRDYIDIPLSKALFSSELNYGQITIYREIKGHSNIIASFPVISDFGKHYYYNSPELLELSSKMKLKRLGDHNSDDYIIEWSDYNSFTVKCKVNNSLYLYKYDLTGSFLEKTLLAADDDNQVNSISDYDIENLWSVFDKKATSYKYFWFLSLLKILNETQNASITYRQILLKMVSSAWGYVLVKNGIFPEIDQIPFYIKKVKSIINQSGLSKEADIEKSIESHPKSADLYSLISPLLKNVPYRFLSPWIPFISNDDVEEKSKKPSSRCLYELHKDHIIIKSIWRNYLITNYDKIINFIEKELGSYLKLGQSVNNSVDVYNIKCLTLSGLLKEIKVRKTNKTIRSFLSKHNLPLNGKITPKEIIDRIPNSMFTVDKNGMKKLNVREGKWSLKVLDELLQKK